MSAAQTRPAAEPVLATKALRRAGLVSLLALIPVAAALGGPKRVAEGLAHAAPMHPYGPDLALIAHAAPAVQLHLAAVTAALLVGIVLLAGVKGRTLHRTLGWAWVVAMMAGASSSLFIRLVNHGSFSFIHLLSGWTIVALPMAVALARRRQARAHARMMTGLFTGGLVLAGALAFMPGRLMWDVFFR